jgi:prefoldin subunit 1
LISKNTVVQILVQIQQTAVHSQRALNLSLQQTAAKDRERRVLQLTIDEINQMKGEIKLYKGIGKMYSLVITCTGYSEDRFWRFMHVPRKEMEEKLKKEEKELADEITSLNKKVCSCYVTQLYSSLIGS